jgi:hypothetical protein
MIAMRSPPLRMSYQSVDVRFELRGRPSLGAR